MIQVFFLIEVFLLMSAGILLADKYGMRLLILINLRDWFYTKKTFRRFFLICGAVLSILTVVFPISPGPMIIGDLLPVITVLMDIIYFLNHSGTDCIPTEFTDKKRTRLGVFTLTVFLIHFILPSVVLV